MNTVIQKIKALRRDESTAFTLTVLIVNVGNYAINLLLGRWLGPHLFAEISILSTMILALSFMGLAFQLSLAKYTALEDLEEGLNQNPKIMGLLENTLSVGLVLGTGFLLLSPWIQSFLHFSSIWPLVITGIGIPIYLTMSALRGMHQGRNQFKNLARNYMAEMVFRLVITIVAVGINAYNDLPDMVSIIIALSFLGSFIAPFVYSFKVLKIRKVTISIHKLRIPKDVRYFMLLVGFYELSQIIISYGDFFMVKHFFTSEESGIYASLSLIGRVVYYATWIIVTLLFPKVIHKVKNGQAHRPLFYKSIMITVLISGFITLSCFILAPWIIHTLFGDAFMAAAPYLGPYALATSLFALSNVFAYYYMSLNKYAPVYFALVFGIIQLVLLYRFGSTFSKLILIQTIGLTNLLALLVFYHIKQESGRWIIPLMQKIRLKPTNL